MLLRSMNHAHLCHLDFWFYYMIISKVRVCNRQWDFPFLSSLLSVSVPPFRPSKLGDGWYVCIHVCWYASTLVKFMFTCYCPLLIVVNSCNAGIGFCCRIAGNVDIALQTCCRNTLFDLLGRLIDNGNGRTDSSPAASAALAILILREIAAATTSTTTTVAGYKPTTTGAEEKTSN